MQAQYIGYIGSFLVCLSLMMSNLKWLRNINLCGATIMTIYGHLIGAVPVMLLNGFIVCIDIYYIFRMNLKKDYFTLNKTLKGNEFFLKQFLEYYKSDIQKFFPEFDFSKILKPKVILISRNLNPVGLFVYEAINPTQLKIHLDYTCPPYRDLKNSHYLFEEQASELKEEGYLEFVAESQVKVHQKFLRKMNFVEDQKNPGYFIKPI